MGYAAGDVGHRMLALGFEHPVLERFDLLQVVDGHRRMWCELMEQVELVVAKHGRPPRGHLDDADHIVSGYERCGQNRGFGWNRIGIA